MRFSLRLVVAALVVTAAACGSSTKAARSGATTTTSSSTTSTSAPTTSTSTSTSTTSTTVATKVADSALVAAAGCTSGCSVLGRVDGGVTYGLVKVGALEDEEVEMRVVAVDGGGRRLWRWPTGDPLTGAPYLTDPITFVRDGSGNLLGEFGAGAHSGFLLALRPSPTGVKDLGSLPNERFASDSPPDLTDADHDGTYELVVRVNDYEPSYAEGTTTETTYRWNGTDYVASSCRKGKDPSKAPVYKPTAGHC